MAAVMEGHRPLMMPLILLVRAKSEGGEGGEVCGGCEVYVCVGGGGAGVR